MASASLRISTLYLGIVILGLSPVRVAVAEEVSEIADSKEIEAKAYELKTIRPSKSGRVYLFQNLDEGFPVDGKIFLLRQGDTPVMAFRVLKTYPTTKRIAAKKLLPYEGFPALERGSQYRAFEKIGDKVAPVPPSPEDVQDLKELEGDALEDLTAIPPPPEEGTPEAPSESPPEETVAPEVTEPTPESFQPPSDEDPELRDTEAPDEYDEIGGYFPNSFTMAVGLLYNGTVPGPNPKFGGGLLYSRNFGAAWAAEGGFFYYKSSGEVNGSTVATTIIPLMGNLRYQQRWKELWTGYVYGGFMYPYVATNVGATNRQLAQIKVISPAVGVGVFLQTGPNWYLRLNLGTDSMTLGVTLRY